MPIKDREFARRKTSPHSVKWTLTCDRAVDAPVKVFIALTCTKYRNCSAQDIAFSERPLTGNQAFKGWFGDSKVVDAQGRPLVVYHGTDADFSEFERTEDIGFHFGDHDAANARAALADEEGGGGNVRPVYLRISNPLRLPDLHTWGPVEVAAALRQAGVLATRQADSFAEYNDREMVRDALTAKGYDGIVYRNETEGSGDSYIVFEPGQIKSAIGVDVH